MAKVKFQLEIGGEKVRTLEQLREHFDIFEGIEYVKNGKLVKWLKSRGEDELAEAVSALDPEDTDCPKKLCCALGIAFNALKYQQLLQIKRGEEERREAEKTRQQEENAQREKIKRGEEERRKAEEEKEKFRRTNVVSASDYAEWAKVQREEDHKKAKERMAAEAEKKREEAKKLRWKASDEGKKNDRERKREEKIYQEPMLLAQMTTLSWRDCTVKSKPRNQHNKEGACHDETRKPRARARA